MTGPNQSHFNTLPANVQAIDGVCLKLRRGAFGGIPSGERFVAELMVREALMNAVVHGSAGRPGAEIRYQIRVLRGGIVIRVEDGGSGFDWRTWRDTEDETPAESGRGLRILRHYADRIQFFGNGSRVELQRKFRERNVNDI